MLNSGAKRLNRRLVAWVGIGKEDICTSRKGREGTLDRPRPIYRVIQEESAILSQMIVYMILSKKVNVYLPSLRMKVPDHVHVFGSLLLQ
jgi:hypothetical protein